MATQYTHDDTQDRALVGELAAVRAELAGLPGERGRLILELERARAAEAAADAEPAVLDLERTIDSLTGRINRLDRDEGRLRRREVHLTERRKDLLCEAFIREAEDLDARFKELVIDALRRIPVAAWPKQVLPELQVLCLYYERRRLDVQGVFANPRQRIKYTMPRVAILFPPFVATPRAFFLGLFEQAPALLGNLASNGHGGGRA